jgi:hypothetical protein
VSGSVKFFVLLSSSDPLTENTTFVGLQSSRILREVGLVSCGSPSQEAVSMFSTEQDSSSIFVLEVT